MSNLLRRNILANFFGQGWSALMQFAFIPLYIKYLGIEAFGLIGLFAVLQSGLTLLDLGMTPTLNREMARFKAGAHSVKSIRELLLSLEIISCGLACLIAIAIFLASAPFARYWLNVEHLSEKSVITSIAIMGVVAALRFMENVYRGALLGLQNHVSLNIFTFIFSSAKGFGVVGVLIFLSPTIEAFFIWQLTLSIIGVLVLRMIVYRQIPVIEVSIGFSRTAVAQVWVFARGMIATTFLSLLLTQLDKILLSKLLGLKEFGAYMLASVLANGLMLLVAPLAQSYAPRFTEFVSKGDKVQLADSYHQSSQLVAVFLIPTVLMLVFHGEMILTLWASDLELAKNTAQLVTILAIGTGFLGLMNIPYTLQLAYGWSSFAAKVNLVIVVFQIPALIWGATRFGAMGAAIVWLLVTSSYIFIVIYLMHKRLLPKERNLWYLHDNLTPLFCSLIMGLIFFQIFPDNVGVIGKVIWLFFSWIIMFFGALFGAPNLRSIVYSKIKASLIGS